MSDLYNRTVKAETLGYAPNEINAALGDTIDSVIKNINKDIIVVVGGIYPTLLPDNLNRSFLHDILFQE